MKSLDFRPLCVRHLRGCGNARRVRRIAAADRRAEPPAEESPRQRNRGIVVGNADIQSVRPAALRG